jgi:hypothetical protein
VLAPGLTGGPLALVTRPSRVLAVSATAEDAGAVVLLYALGPDGLPSGDPDSVGGSESDRFGSALAASGSMLVIGAPGQDVGWARGAGAIVVLRFRSATEYDTDGYTQDSADVPGDPQYEDHFGESLAAGDGYVVVGVPNDRDRDAIGGRVQPFQVGADGLTPLPSLSQGVGDVPGKGERGDGFGRSLAILHACPGVPGVLVGAPAEVVRGTVLAGSVWILPLAGGCEPKQVFEEANGLSGGQVENAVLGGAVTVLRTAPDRADTAVVVAPGTSEEGVWGRVLTLDPPYTATTTVLSGLHLGAVLARRRCSSRLSRSGSTHSSSWSAERWPLSTSTRAVVRAVASWRSPGSSGDSVIGSSSTTVHGRTGWSGAGSTAGSTSSTAGGRDTGAGRQVARVGSMRPPREDANLPPPPHPGTGLRRNLWTTQGENSSSSPPVV